MIRKTAIAALFGAAVMSFAVPAAAAAFTSSDGVLSLELPGEQWQEIVDPVKWIALSDGTNEITVEHFSNGEKLPDMSITDGRYERVCQTILSTPNEVFVLTGKLVNADQMQELINTLASVKILRYDTKLAIKSEAAADVSEFSLVPMNKTMYATTGVNIRSGCSTDDQILGGVNAGDALQVTGSVQRNGQDFGWYQINYNGGTGYVSAGFVSETAPAAGTASANATAGLTRTGSTISVYWQNSNGETLYEYSDGNYYSESGVRYTYNSSSNVYQGSDGTTLYPNPDQLDRMMGASGTTSSSSEETNDAANEMHVLVRESDGKEAYVYAGGGAYYDDEGTEYSWINDGQMMDFYGHIYNVRW